MLLNAMKIRLNWGNYFIKCLTHHPKRTTTAIAAGALN